LVTRFLYEKTTPAQDLVAGVEKQTHNGGCGEGQIAKPGPLENGRLRIAGRRTFIFHAKNRAWRWQGASEDIWHIIVAFGRHCLGLTLGALVSRLPPHIPDTFSITPTKQ
jgi:hypothetical protein